MHPSHDDALRDEAVRVRADSDRMVEASALHLRSLWRLHNQYRQLIDDAVAGRRSTPQASPSPASISAPSRPVPVPPVIPARSTPALDAQNPLPAMLAAAGHGEDDLDDIADALVAAYRKAEAVDDGEMQVTLRHALLLLGHHMATKLGPKVAGVTLN